MRTVFSQKLYNLAEKLSNPLYAVGGVVRNFLIDKSLSLDVDLSSTVSEEELCAVAESVGFKITTVYKRTGTVVFSDGETKYEYTRFRKESYVKGEHTPQEIVMTDSIEEDARRRDFRCNAVYYDLKNFKYVDPLNGIADIKDKVLDTVIDAERVFCHDGLRLLRLARFAGELNFKPTEKVIFSAKKFADNILDISPERIYSELKLILVADHKYPFSDKRGHYTALKILDNTRVLDRIFPELTLGRGMAQRADFHKFDVLEHSLRSMLYAHPKIRLAALLHDVGKPFCYKRDGKYHYHYLEGQKIAEEILERLKVDKATIRQVKYLIKEHMVDLDCSMSEKKVRKFLVDNYNNLDQLLLVKQADFRASLEADEIAPTLSKWSKVLTEMRVDGTPFSLKELEISATDLEDMGFEGHEIGAELKRLWDYAVNTPTKNTRAELINMAIKDLKKLK